MASKTWYKGTWKMTAFLILVFALFLMSSLVIRSQHIQTIYAIVWHHPKFLGNAYQANITGKVSNMPKPTQKAPQSNVENVSYQPERTRKAPQTNVVYIKTHKCASETLFAVFRRYGYERHLAFVLPVDGRNNLGWPEPLDEGMYRPSKTGSYNMLCEHTILTLPHMANIMPNDTMFVTSIREPMGHLKSAFDYFNIKKVAAITSSDPLSEYLRHLDQYDTVYKARGNRRRGGYCIPAGLSVTQNSMAFHLGFPTGFAKGTKDQTRNNTFIDEWINLMDQRFDLVLVVEYFVESLVLLRRTLHWNTKDVIYKRRNSAPHRKKENVIDPALVRNYKIWSQVDYILHDHFNKTLWKKIANEGNDFWDELKDFKEVLDKTGAYCKVVNKHRVDS